MTNSFSKSIFLGHLNKLKFCIDTAQKSNNVAEVLYSSSARTSLFMLQAMCRAFINIYGKKPFTKILEKCKSLEDGLGAVDYYDAYQKQFVKNNERVASFLQSKKNEKIEALSTILKEDKWLKKNKNRINKITQKIDDVNWLSNEEELIGLKNFYKIQIKKNELLLKKSNPLFIEIENGVHEFRRDIRWLSIYTNAFAGLFKYDRKELNKTSVLKKYFTKEIINLPYNILAAPNKAKNHITLNKEVFFATSYLINELGKLKDEGLRLEAVTEALHFYKKRLPSETEVLKVCSKSQKNKTTILKEANKLTTDFFKLVDLNNLI